MLNLFAKIAMALSLAYFGLVFLMLWLGQLMGWHNDIWDFFDFPEQTFTPALWFVLLCAAMTAVTYGCLAMAYHAVWRILNGGPGQDFRALAANIKRLGFGMILFWLGFNLIGGGLQYILILLHPELGLVFDFAPLDFDILFFITGVVILAIGQTMSRAWEAEEENQQFL